MNELRQSKAFRAWLEGIKDRRIKTIIATRMLRLVNGITGDAQPVGEGISELRIHYGPGYRIYFQQRGRFIVLILCGGSKGSQSRDIALAKMLARNWTQKDEYEE